MLQYWLGVHHRALCGVHVHRAPGCTGFEHPFTTLGAWRPHSPFPIGGCIFKQPLGFGRLPPLDPKQGRTVPRTAARPARSTTLTRCHADAYCNVDTHYRALYLIVILPIDKPGVSLRGRGGIVLLHGVGEEGSSLKKKKTSSLPVFPVAKSVALLEVPPWQKDILGVQAGGGFRPLARREIGVPCLQVPALKTLDKLTFSPLSGADAGSSTLGHRDGPWQESYQQPDGN